MFSQALWLLLAAVWLFPLGWTVLSSFKTSKGAIFERPLAPPDGITFANLRRTNCESRRDYIVAKGSLLANLPP